jgi:hypothetical protein
MEVLEERLVSLESRMEQLEGRWEWLETSLETWLSGGCAAGGEVGGGGRGGGGCGGGPTGPVTAAGSGALGTQITTGASAAGPVSASDEVIVLNVVCGPHLLSLSLSLSHSQCARVL